MKRRVQQRRVDPVAPRLCALLLAQRDLGIDRLAVFPGGPQSLEGGAVFEAELSEALVEVLGLDRLGPRWWPLGERLCGGGLARREDALGVAGPLGALAALGAGVDR